MPFRKQTQGSISADRNLILIRKRDLNRNPRDYPSEQTDRLTYMMKLRACNRGSEADQWKQHGVFPIMAMCLEKMAIFESQFFDVQKSLRQRSSRSSLIVGKPHLGSRLTSQRVVRLSGNRGGY